MRVQALDLTLDTAITFSCGEIAGAPVDGDRFFAALEDDQPLELSVHTCEFGSRALYAPGPGGNAIDVRTESY